MLNADCLRFKLEAADVEPVAWETAVPEAVVGASSDGGETRVGDTADDGGGGGFSSAPSSTRSVVLSLRLASSL